MVCHSLLYSCSLHGSLHGSSVEYLTQQHSSHIVLASIERNHCLAHISCMCRLHMQYISYVWPARDYHPADRAAGWQVATMKQ